jgi:ribosomal protein L7/L12
MSFKEYRGFKYSQEQVAVQTARPSLAAMKRGDFSGRWKKETVFTVLLPDGGTKTVPSLKRVREYVDNYLGD